MSDDIDIPIKICCTCKEEKPISQFYKFKRKDRDKPIYRSECSVCYRKRKRKRDIDINEEYEKWYKKIPKKCEKCGETRPYLIDFHHINPLLKSLEISVIRSKSWSLQRKIKMAEEEMEKCIQLCSNCHREFHYLERHYELTLDEYL